MFSILGFLCFAGKFDYTQPHVVIGRRTDPISLNPEYNISNQMVLNTQFLIKGKDLMLR